MLIMQPIEYRKMAEVEDGMWYYRALHGHVVRNLQPLSSSATILDAGCGTGGLLRKLSHINPSWQIAGLDFSPLACELARERSGVAVVQGSITALPFSDESFDAIISCDVVCQVREPVDAIQQFSRCLKPGGMLILTMPAYQWMYSYHDVEVANLRRYTRNEVSSLLNDAGLRVTGSTYWNMLPFPLAVLRRKILPPPTSGSDVRRFPALLETGFNSLMALERAWLLCGGRMPFGSSVLTVGRKPSQDVVSPDP